MQTGSLNDTPRGSRLHIAVFGRRNAGKSSMVNALTNQNIAIVSRVPGTTTDPVYKSMEILPLGPVVIIDTAGIDDEGELGDLRIEKTLEVLNRSDLMVLVMDLEQGAGDFERELMDRAREKNVAVVGVLNKIDLNPGQGAGQVQQVEKSLGIKVLPVSTLTRQGIEELKGEIIKGIPGDLAVPTILGDIINPGDNVVLVVPIDHAAPKGRLILPQMQTIRDILDNDACAMVVKETELKEALGQLSKKPRLVVTDSQVFPMVDAETPGDIMLTSFSILFARYKGNLEALVAGARAVEKLKPGHRVLIAEACTHHRVTDDIGTVKIPRWLRQKVGGELHFDWASGSSLPKGLEQYNLIVHCGACMVNRREMLYRIMQAASAGVPIVNYGVLIAHLHGILKRVLSPFPGALEFLDQ